MKTIDLTKLSVEDRELVEISNDAENMSLNELLKAISKVSKRLYKSTGENKYKNISAFAFGCAFAMDEGLTGDDVCDIGWAAVDIVNEENTNATD